MSVWGLRVAGVALLAIGAADVASAQSFDCAKAQSPVERAVCAAPGLREQDAELAKVYARLLAQAPARAADLTREQRQWLADRSRSCVPAAPAPSPTPGNRPPAPGAAPAPAATPATPPAASIPCLEGMYRTRLATLQAESARVAAAALPAQRVAPVARLDREAVSASGSSDVRLHVEQPGAFTVSVESATGVSLQLVDMMEGPREVNGEPGIRDGRLDALLDVGTYKLRLAGGPRGKGDAKLKLTSLVEVEGASSALISGGRLSTQLADGQLRSYWIEVKEPGRVFVEAAGRALRDLRLWRNGTDLAELSPRMSIMEPRAGQPLNGARIDGKVEPGIYLVTAYGGPAMTWAGGGNGQPLHVSVGTPELLASGWADGIIGPLGRVRFTLPAEATYLRLEIPEPAAARMSVTRNGGALGSAELTRRSREPFVNLRLASGEERVVEIAGVENQRFRLRTIAPLTSRSITGTGPHYVAVDIAGENADELVGTAVLERLAAPNNPSAVLASNAPRVGPTQGWRRKFNLRGPSTLIFEVAAPTAVALRGEGIGFRAAIEPLLGYQAPRADGRTPNRWDLEPGWYILRLEGLNGAVGVVDLTLGPPGLVVEAAKPAPGRPVVPLGIHTLARESSYVLLLNSAPTLALAPVVRALPAPIENAPLTVFQNQGQALDLSVRIPAPAPGRRSSRTAPASRRLSHPKPSRTQAASSPCAFRRSIATARSSCPGARRRAQRLRVCRPRRPCPWSAPARRASSTCRRTRRETSILKCRRAASTGSKRSGGCAPAPRSTPLSCRRSTPPRRTAPARTRWFRPICARVGTASR